MGRDELSVLAHLRVHRRHREFSGTSVMREQWCVVGDERVAGSRNLCKFLLKLQDK